MEVQPVTFNTYRMIFLQNESLILGIPRLIRDFCRRRSLQSRFAMVFMVFTMLFVLVFPTLGGAMTGYSGNVMAYVLDWGGNYVPFNDFRIVAYTVHDGSRINHTDNLHATLYKSDLGESLSQDHGCVLELIRTDEASLLDISNWYGSYNYDHRPDCYDSTYDPQRLKCSSDQLLFNISQCQTTPLCLLYLPLTATPDIGLYGTEPQDDVASIYGGATLTSPTLNITVYDISYRLNQTKGQTLNWYSDFEAQSAMFISGNTLYTSAEVAEIGQCQAQKVRKQNSQSLSSCLTLYRPINGAFPSSS